MLRQINARLDLDSPLTVDRRDRASGAVCGRWSIEADATRTTTSDWLQLSRKHEIEIERDRGVVTIFGGKLTDCLNVGEEVLDAVVELGVSAGELDDSWYGEPGDEEWAAFELRVLETEVVDRECAGLLWRRYGVQANRVLDRVAADPSLGETIWDDPRYIRAEVVEIGDSEMVTKVEDFLRRRTGLALTEHHEDLATRHGEFAALLGLAPV